MLDERVVLLSGSLCQRLEPVCIVSDPVLCCPLLHAGSNSIGNGPVETCAIINDVNHLLVHILRQVLVHLFAIENLLAEILARSLTGYFYVERLLLECLTDNLKS